MTVTQAVFVVGVCLMLLALAGLMFNASLRDHPKHTPPPSAPQKPPTAPREHRRDDGPMAMVQAPDGVWRFR